MSIVKDYLIDMLDNTYNALINEVFNQINKQQMDQQEFDKYHFFKLSSFMIQVQRLRAYDEHEKKKRAAIANASKAQEINDGGKSLFETAPRGKGLGSKPRQIGPKVPKIPFEINISSIGASLQLQNFEFLYTQMYKKIKNNKENPVNDKEFHSGLQLLIQFLYVIRDMASSLDERNQRNAKILQANVFYNDLCLICQFAFNLYDHRKHNQQFLSDTIEFTHIMLEMLDEYSKGKVLTIQTQRKRKVKKNKKARNKRG